MDDLKIRLFCVMLGAGISQLVSRVSTSLLISIYLVGILIAALLILLSVLIKVKLKQSKIIFERNRMQTNHDDKPKVTMTYAFKSTKNAIHMKNVITLIALSWIGALVFFVAICLQVKEHISSTKSLNGFGTFGKE